MLSLRIVTTNYYQAKPIPGLDTTHSEFRNTPVSRVPVLRIFGSTPAGQKTCMHVHGVFPYLYVPYDGTQPSDRYLRQFASSLDKALNVANRQTNSHFQHVYKISLVSGIPMYGYHPEEEYFLKIYLFSPANIRKAADLLLGGAVMNKPFQPHESHLPYALQMFIDYNLYGMNLLNAGALKFRKRASDEKSANKSVKTMNTSLKETHDTSILKASSPEILSSSSSSSPVDHVWHQENIPSDLWLPAEIERQSTCELEVDVVAADILNRHELASNIGANPGLTALWEDEKQRRRDAGGSSQLEPDSSQERDCVVPSASEQELVARFLNIVKQQQVFRNSQSDESFPSQPSLPASQVESHVSREDSNVGSQNTVMLSDSDDAEGGGVEVDEEYAPIVSMNSIERVVSCSQSFLRTASQKDMLDSQDRSVADILAALLEESGPPPSQLASLEDQDSILNQSIILDKEGEMEEAEESLLMTQFINEAAASGTSSNTSLLRLDDPWHDNADTDVIMNTDDSDDEVDLLPQFDGASDKIPDSHVKSDQGQATNTTTSQSAGTSQVPGVTSQNPTADTGAVNRTDVNWRTGATGRAVASTQGFPSGSGSWTQQSWSQQPGAASATWHGQSPSWSHQQNYQNWPQHQPQLPSAAFSSQQAAFHSSSPATTFQSPPHNPYASPTHQQAYQTPSPSAPHHQYQYPSYQSPASNQSYQQPYQSPSQHPYQSPGSSQTFHTPQSYHSSSSNTPFQSSSGQPFSPSAAAGQAYQLPASNKSYASSPGSQPYQSPSVSQPYQSPQSSSGYQPASGQMYPSPYQSPSQSHHSSPQQPYPAAYQSPVHSVRYPSQSSWCAQGYPGYYQGLAGGHVAGTSGKHTSSTGPTQSLQPEMPFGQTCHSSSSGLNSFPAPDLQQHQQTCTGSHQQMQTDVHILNKPTGSHIVTGPETQSVVVPQPTKKKGRKAKAVAESCEFKSPQPPCLSPTSIISKNHFESSPLIGCLQSSNNTPPLASGTGFSLTKLPDFGESTNVNVLDGKSVMPGSKSSEPLLATKISTLEFKPNIAQCSVGSVSTEFPSSKCVVPLDHDQSSGMALKVEASTSTPMIQQLLMEEPVRMNIRKEDREAVMKKPTSSPAVPKPRKKYTRRTDQGVRKPGRPRSTSLSAPAHLAVGYCGYSQPTMNLPTNCRQDKSHTAPVSFNGESSMPSPMQNYAWQQHWKQQQNFQVGSQWQQQQQPQQQQWGMNDWQGYNSLGEGSISAELDINAIPANSRMHQRSLSADTINSPIFEHSAHPGQLPPFSADHLGMQSNSASIDQPVVHREGINDKSSLSSLFQLVSDVGSEDIDWESTSSAVVPNLFPNSNESETPKSTPSSDVNQGSPLVKDFITLEAPCKQLFEMTEKANSDTAGMTSSEESDRTDQDLSNDLKPRTINRSYSLGSCHPRLGKQSRLKKLGLLRSTDLGSASGPVESNPSYTYTFHVPTPVFKKLKFFRSVDNRKHNIKVVRMHPMDARRYSLLKIGREIVKAVKLTEVDLAKHNVSLPSPYPFVSADGSTNRVNLDIPVVSVDRRSGDSGSEESSLSKFDTDFPPNKVAPPSFFHAGQVSASLTRSASTVPRGSPVSSDWLRQYTGQQPANYNGRFSPGMQAAYSPQHTGISPQYNNFPFAQQQRDGSLNSFSGHQHMPQNNMNRHFSSQPSEGSSGLTFQQLSHKGNSFYPQTTTAPTQSPNNYYPHQQDTYMNQTPVIQQQSIYQQQYHQQQYQLQQQFAQQQPETSLNSSNPEPKNGLRSPGQHGLISKIDSGSVLGHSGDQEPECDKNATETSPFNTRVNARRRDIHAEHMASCAAPQNAHVYTTFSSTLVGSTNDNSDSNTDLSSQIQEHEQQDTRGDQVNDFCLQSRISSSRWPKQFRRLSLRKSGKYKSSHVEDASSLNESQDMSDKMVNGCPNETSGQLNVMPSVPTQDPNYNLHTKASATPGPGRRRERTSWQKNVKALRLKIPVPHSDQTNGGVNGLHDSFHETDVESTTSSQKESDADDHEIRDDFSPSSSSVGLAHLDDDASTVAESRRSPRQAKLRSIYSKNRYLKPKKKRRKRQKRLVEGIHYIVVGKFRGHQVMLVKVKKLNLDPTQRVKADLFEDIAAKDIVRIVSPLSSGEGRVSGKELETVDCYNGASSQTDAMIEDMHFNSFNQQATSASQACHQASRGRSLRHGRFRSAHTVVTKQAALPRPTGNEAESKNVLAGLISGNVRGNSISEASENIHNCCQFMYDHFFFMFKESFTKHKTANKLLSNSKTEEGIKDFFFENVKISNFCSFQQKFLANMEKLRSNDYSSSSDDEDDVLDETVFKSKLGIPHMSLTCARNELHFYQPVKNGYSRSEQSLLLRESAVSGNAGVRPRLFADLQLNKLELMEITQDKPRLLMEANRTITMNNTALCSDDKNTPSPSSECCFDENTETQEPGGAVIRGGQLPPETNNGESECVFKEKSRNLHIAQGTGIENSCFINHSILVNTALCTDSMKIQEEKEDYLQSQMAFFEDISSDSDSSGTIIMDNFVAGGNHSDDEELPLLDCRSAVCESMSSTNVSELSETCVASVNSIPSAEKEAPSEDTSIASSAAEVCNTTEHTQLSIFGENYDTTKNTVNDNSSQHNIHVCTSENEQGMLAHVQGSILQRETLGKIALQIEDSGTSVLLAEALEKSVGQTQALIESISQLSEFSEDLSLQSNGKYLKLPDAKTNVLCESDDDATIELDMSHDISSKDSDDAIKQFPISEEREQAGNRAMAKLDSDNDLDSSVSVNSSDRPKRHGKAMKKSKRDKGSNLVNRRQFMDDGNSSSNDELNAATEKDVLSHNKHLRQRKRTLYTYYTDIYDSSEADSSDSSDEDFNSRTSHRKGSKNSRKHKGDKQNKKLHQINVDFGKAVKSGHRAGPTRGKKKKPSGGDKLLNSLSLLHMATLANLTETQADGQSVSSVAIDNVHNHSLQYSDLATSDHNTAFTPSLEHMSFISPQNSDEFAISPPMACSPTDKNRWQPTRGSHHRPDEIAVSRRLLNSQRLTRLKPGCNGASNLGSKPIPFSRLISNSASPIPSNFSFSHISDSSLRTEPPSQCEDAGTSNTLQLLETRRAQVNCASFSMKDILRLTTPDDSMDSDSKDSAALIRPPEPKRAQVKSTSLSMSDILKLTNVDKGLEMENPQSSYSLLSLLSNPSPCSDLSPSKTTEVPDQQTTQLSCHQQLAEDRPASNYLSQNMSIIKPVAEIQHKITEATSPHLPQISDVSLSPSIPQRGASEASTNLNKSDTQRQKFTAEFSQLVKDSCSDTDMDSSLATPDKTLDVPMSGTTEGQTYVKHPSVSATSISEVNSYDHSSDIRMKYHVKTKMSRHKKKKRHERKRDKSRFHTAVNITTAELVAPVNLNVDSLDARPAAEQLLQASDVQSVIMEMPICKSTVCEKPPQPLLQTLPSPVGKQQLRTSHLENMPDEDEVVPAAVVSSVPLSVRSDDPVVGHKELASKSQNICQAHRSPQTNICGTPGPTILEIPTVSDTRDETSMFDRFHSHRSLTYREDQTDTIMKIKDIEQMLKPLHPLQIPAYPFIGHSFDSQIGHIAHSTLNPCLCYPYCWQWPVHTPGSDPAASPLNLCTVEKSPNNRCPVAPISPVSPSYQSHAQPVGFSGVSPPVKKVKPLWYPWLTVESFGNRPDLNANMIHQAHDYSDGYKADRTITSVCNVFPTNKSPVELSQKSLTYENTCSEPRNKKHNISISSNTPRESSRGGNDFVSRSPHEADKARTNTDKLFSCQTVSELLGNVIEAEYEQRSPSSADSVSRPIPKASSKSSHGADAAHKSSCRQGIEQKFGVAADVYRKGDADILGISYTSELNKKYSRLFSEEIEEKSQKKYSPKSTKDTFGADIYKAVTCKPEYDSRQITEEIQSGHFGISSSPKHVDNVLTGLADKLVTKLIQGDLGYLHSEPSEAAKGKKCPNSSSQKTSNTSIKSNEDKRNPSPEKTEKTDKESETGSVCKDRQLQDETGCGNTEDITVRPVKLPPSRGAVEENMHVLGLSSVQPPVAFCSNPEDLPDRPMEHGGRVLKVESKRLSEFSPFITSKHIIGIQIWRSHSLSSSKLLASQSQGRPLRDRLEQDPQMQFLLTGEQRMAVSPVCTPPSRRSVQKWLQNKMVDIRATKPVDSYPQIRQSHGRCIAVDAITDEKYQKCEDSGSFNTSTQNLERLSVNLSKQDMKEEQLDISIGEKMPSQTSLPEIDSSECVDTDLDVSCTSNTTPVILATSAQRSIIPLSTPSFVRSQESSPTNSRPASRAQRKRKLRFADDCTRDVPEVSSPTESQTLDEHYKKTKKRISAVEAQTNKQEIAQSSYNSHSSTPKKESLKGLLDIACTPISSPQDSAKQSSQDSAKNTPQVAQKSTDGPDIPILRHMSTNTESLLYKTILTTQTQRQASDLGLNDVSQIEGPTPRNSFGFKVAQTHMQDSKVLHKYQHVTVFSMELHVETRGDLRPDPEFDSVKALFYSVLNDIPPENGTRNITGVLVVDLDSCNKVSGRKGKEQMPGDTSDSPATPFLPQCAASPGVVPDHLPSVSAASSSASPKPSSHASSEVTSSTPGNIPTRLPELPVSQPSTSTQSSGIGKQRPVSLPGHPVSVPGHGAATGDALLEKCAVEGMEVTYVRDEIDLINTFTQLVTQFDPDIVVGFEIQMLSWGYLLQRAAQLNVDLCSRISRVQDAKNESHFCAEKDEWGADRMSEIHIAGRIVLNLWRVLRHEINLNVYSFENVVYHVLHQRIPLYSFRCLTKWYSQQAHLHRWRVFEHYFRRVRGQLDVIDQLDLIGKTSEFARVFGIEFYDVLARGSQIRVESMMLRLAKPMNFVPVSPGVQQRARQKAAECIPLNLEPESKYYTSPVAVLDFQSLYPSIMIAYNYCFTTCLGRLDSLEKAHEGAFEFGCTSLNLSPAVLKKIRDFVTVSPNGVAFLKSSVRRGILPIMVEEILNTRLMVKKSMKAYKDDKILSRMLDARQLGLKLIANVTYGYTGANFSGRMPCIEVADSIVRKARESLERAIELVRSTPKWGAHVIYGDTDSMFIHFPGRSKDEAFVLGQEIADAVTAMFPKPIKLRFEKIYLPCVLQTKKRYVGFMYETQDQAQPVYDAKGIETVRRDACSAVSKVLERSIKVLFSTHDLSRVKQYVTRQLHKLLEGKVSIIDLVFAKEYRGMMGYKPGACIPSLEIARRRLRLDRRSEPRVGERVPYVIVHGSPGLPLIQLVKEPSELIADTSLRLNATYYITKQILPPLDRIFSLIGVNVFTWYLDMPKVVRVGPVMGPSVSNKQGTISQFFATNNCPVCDTQTKLPVCEQCRKDSQLVTFMLTRRIQDWEKTHCQLTQVCVACQGTQDCEQACVSIDCPVMFRRIIANNDLIRADNLQEILTKYLQF